MADNTLRAEQANDFVRLVTKLTPEQHIIVLTYIKLLKTDPKEAERYARQVIA